MEPGALSGFNLLLVILFIASASFAFNQPQSQHTASSNTINQRSSTDALSSAAEFPSERTVFANTATAAAAAAAVAGTVPANQPARIVAAAAHSNLVQQVIFVMGVEGTGHHGIKPLLHEMTNLSGIKMYEANNPHREFGQATRNCIKERNATCLQEVIRERVQHSTSRGAGTLVVFKGSLPGRKSNPRAECLFWENASQVDCMEELAKFPVYDLVWVMDAVKVVVPDVKVIMLNRDFANLVMSHEIWDGGLDHHAKTMAVFLQYICHMVRTAVPTSDWVRLDYESFAAVKVETLLSSLGRFLGWQTEQTDWLTDHNSRKIKHLQNLLHISSRNATESMPAEELALVQTIVHEYTSAGKWKEHNDEAHYLLNRYPTTA